MYTIDENTHIASTLASLDKIYNKAKINGLLEPENLYILDAIYKLTNGCYDVLTNTEYKILLNKYVKILDSKINVIKALSCNTTEPQLKPVFIQSEANDCNDYVKSSKIYYWQEEDYTTTNLQIVNKVKVSGFLSTKPSTTYLAFKDGKLINYTNVGKICFALTESLITDDYLIYDILNNDITSTFTKTFIDLQNITVYTSNNIYGFGNITFKIKNS